MREIIVDLVRQAVAALQRDAVLPTDVSVDFKVERPREKTHGDFSTNVAMIMAKPAGMKPRDLAARVLAALPPGQTDVDRWEVAGPGFINFFMSRKRWLQLPATILEAGAAYGRSSIGNGRRIQVEFVSANPTGPMHVGHGRGAVTGDVLATLLDACGFQVEREYYINDAGVQIQVLGRSVLTRYRQLAGHDVALPDGCYPGEYIIDIARSCREQHGDRWLEAESPPPEMIDLAIAMVMNWIRDDLASLSICFDTWFSERRLHARGLIPQVIAQLERKDLIYQGVLEPPKGKLPEDWEARPQCLFRSTRFGDEVDRPLQKSDGSYTYFAADIAYHADKVERGFDQLIDVWGADHGGYIKRVRAALEALTGRKNLLDVQLVQMVNLTRAGKPVRMSKRAGTFVTLREVVDEVGSDAVRFWFLTRSGNARLDFDLDLAVTQSHDNPVYYVQYAHARVCALFRQLTEKGLPSIDGDPERLGQPVEMDLLRLLSLLPEVVEGAALAHEPHRLAYYLQELAAHFHNYYNATRILDEDPALRGARLQLVAAVRQVIANGLKLLGVSAPEKMERQVIPVSSAQES
ncbi:MAG: arginine--tRNA ligase [Magnetococcales bacterium]|nr:arginine--tRNA ligase [Magnetococcales bacterium]